MSTTGSAVSIETNIADYNTMLGRYIALQKLLPDEVLEKKGRALGVALYEGFAAHKFGGPGKKQKRLAEAEFSARVALGKGIKVRASLLEAYKAERGKFGSAIRSLGQLGRHANKSAAKSLAAESRKMRGLRTDLWRRIVGRELSARQAGIGMLAASFLWYRKRSSQSKGTYYMPNRTGKPLGYVDRGDGYLRIVGEAAGLDVVDPRYGIVSRALAVETADMVPYIERREREIFDQTLGGRAA